MASSLFAFAVQKPRVLAPPPNVIDETMIFDSIELERKLDEQLASALSKETPDAEGEKRACRCDTTRRAGQRRNRASQTMKSCSAR